MNDYSDVHSDTHRLSFSSSLQALLRVGLTAVCRRLWISARVIVAATALPLAACSGGTGERSALSTSSDAVAAIQQSSPARCSEAMAPVIAQALETQDMNALVVAWGSESPAFQVSTVIMAAVYEAQYQSGAARAAKLLVEYSTNVCFDGDVANWVLMLSPGDPGFVTYCLDGSPPSAFESAPLCPDFQP